MDISLIYTFASNSDVFPALHEQMQYVTGFMDYGFELLLIFHSIFSLRVKFLMSIDLQLHSFLFLPPFFKECI